MKLAIQFGSLDLLMKKMGANELSWREAGNQLSELDFIERLAKGIEIELSEVEVNELGLLVYKGQQVLLYIRDSYIDKDTLLHDPDNAVRYHVSDCKKLEEMREKNRFERYVVTNNTSGVFRVNSWDKFTKVREEVQSSLRVCKLCLKHLSYGNYESVSRAHQSALWREFSIEDFLAHYSPNFRSVPRYTSDDAPPPGYSKDWPEISRRFRESVGWRCNRCKVDLSSHRQLLHVHHENGSQSDNRAENLRALCIVCHDNEPDHRLFVSASAIALIHQLRRQQGLK